MKIILTLIFTLLILSNNGCNGHAKDPPAIIINDSTPAKPNSIPAKPDSIPPIKVLTIREKLIDSINTQLYVRETSPNRGPMVDKYLTTVGSVLGVAWCGAFVGANLTWQEVPNPKSAWSPDYAKPNDIIWMPKKKTSIEPLPGDVVTYYYSNLGRVGHVGFFEKADKDDYFITIEGNTNGAGSREGDGVYKKKRDPNKVYAASRYIKQ